MSSFAVTLRRGPLTLMLDRRGAVITGFSRTASNGAVYPLMRTARDYAGDPLSASCFPLVPFGNRVTGNRFAIAGQTYAFTPNQPWDKHYLHGDGWLSEWQVTQATDTQLVLALTHRAAPGRPYAFDAQIVYELTEHSSLTVAMEVRNRGSAPLPFGLGLHPYFPLTPQTRLQASAEAFFSEKADFMPGGRGPIPADVDFADGRALPRRWLNNGFTGWPGQARITWPEQKLSLRISASSAFRHYFVFMSDKTFEPDFAGDYFCFEPMTHQADGHHAPDLGGLVLLKPGECVQGQVTFKPEDVAS